MRWLQILKTILVMDFVIWSQNCWKVRWQCCSDQLLNWALTATTAPPGQETVTCGSTDLPEAVTVSWEGCQVSFSWCCCPCRNVGRELRKKPTGGRNQCFRSATSPPPRHLLPCSAPWLGVILHGSLAQLSCRLYGLQFKTSLECL